MDISTIEAIGTLVNSIGLPATIGVIAILTAFYLLPVLAEYLRAKIELNKATAARVRIQHSASIEQLPVTNQQAGPGVGKFGAPGPQNGV